MPNTKLYRFIDTFSDQERFDRVQYDVGKFMHRGGEPVALTDEQHETLARFIVMDEARPEEAAPTVDQPGPFGPSTSTASDPNAGTTPDLTNMSFEEKKDLARTLEIHGRSGKNEEELTALLVEHFNSPTAGQEGVS